MTDSSERFHLLRASYARSLAAKQAALAEAWRAFVATRDGKTARTLLVLVHRLAGSAPAYDYAALGTLAMSVDRVFTEWIEATPETRGSADDLVAGVSQPMQALLDALARHAAEATDLSER